MQPSVCVRCARVAATRNNASLNPRRTCPLMHTLVSLRNNNTARERSLEYADRFQQFPMDVRRGRPLPQELSVGGEFYASTEK